MCHQLQVDIIHLVIRPSSFSLCHNLHSSFFRLLVYRRFRFSVLSRDKNRDLAWVHHFKSCEDVYH